jgi:hypothetical protein
MSEKVQVLIITGTMGTGKTTVLLEASDILSAAGIIHAAIDLDMLGTSYLPDVSADELMFRNLASVWSNYQAAGIRRLLLAEAVESREDLNRIRAAVPDAQIVICRLLAGIAIAEERIRTRETGMLQHKFVARVGELEKLLDNAHFEDFSITNDHAPITHVAREMLTRAEWM